MTVTLNERSEQIVKQQLQAGHYASVEEAVNRIIEEQWAETLMGDEQLEASLIAALNSPRRPFQDGVLLERAKLRLATQHPA
jgi:Arc/MetJ-type ribon-helix-helix transcriptional regulator